MDNQAPGVDERWCDEQRAIVSGYLRSQAVQHGRIGVWPAWHVAPCVSIWAVESLAQPEWIGWWAITGDLPTDYISSADVPAPQHPRKAILAIAERWLKQAQAWNEGREYEGIRIAGPVSHKQLAPLLESRAKLLVEWANDESFWDEE